MPLFGLSEQTNSRRGALEMGMPAVYMLLISMHTNGLRQL